MRITIYTRLLEINLDGQLVFYIPTGNGTELNDSCNPINFLRASSECSGEHISRAIVAFLLFLLAEDDYVGKK
jgi:hypothetical protein